VFRTAFFTACLALTWLTGLVSHAETAATGSAAGPLCRLAAWCTASSYRAGAVLGGNDGLRQFLNESDHLRQCVRAAAPETAPTSSVAFLAHVLFEY
jgi:hypothetical protein